jgi:hypothetical protein
MEANILRKAVFLRQETHHMSKTFNLYAFQGLACTCYVYTGNKLRRDGRAGFDKMAADSANGRSFKNMQNTKMCFLGFLENLRTAGPETSFSCTIYTSVDVNIFRIKRN